MAQLLGWRLNNHGGVLSLNDWAIIIGIVCTIGTFGVNWYYKRKEREDRLNGNVTSAQK